MLAGVNSHIRFHLRHFEGGYDFATDLQVGENEQAIV
jgi:hypothetical protein